jgi:predicted acyl esterase
MIYASIGKQLYYHGEPFETDTEITGFFSLRTWLSIDQPDTDIRAAVFEIQIDGTSLLLASDAMRARYRESLRAEALVQTTQPMEYVFKRFTFISRLVRKGHRLRLVIGPVHSIYSQRNHNSGREVSRETLADARTVCVKLFHDCSHPSVLLVPLGAEEAPDWAVPRGGPSIAPLHIGQSE